MNVLSIDSGAKRAIERLGCLTCQLSEVCVVGQTLADKVETGEANAVFMKKTTMLANAPSWLSAARLGSPGVDSGRIKQLVEDSNPADLGIALDTRELDLDALLCGAENEPLASVNKQDIPELASITNIAPETGLPANRIITEKGDAFTVIDASEAVGFKGEPLSAADYGILSSKLLTRMQEHNEAGVPHVMDSDGTMQKTLRHLGNAELTEIRMTGKNRLYTTVSQGAPDETGRIVILGSHGGDAATQQAFLQTIRV